MYNDFFLRKAKIGLFSIYNGYIQIIYKTYEKIQSPYVDEDHIPLAYYCFFIDTNRRKGLFFSGSQTRIFIS